MSLLDVVLDQHMTRCGESEGSLGDDGRLAYSIRSHLTLLLNTRQGSLAHMKDYGLPDIPALYRGLPYSTQGLLRDVKATIEKYEPRLTKVNVRQMESPQADSVLRLGITGVVREKRLNFDAHFLSNGSAEIYLEEAH